MTVLIIVLVTMNARVVVLVVVERTLRTRVIRTPGAQQQLLANEQPGQLQTTSQGNQKCVVGQGAHQVSAFANWTPSADGCAVARATAPLGTRKSTMSATASTISRIIEFMAGRESEIPRAKPRCAASGRQGSDMAAKAVGTPQRRFEGGFHREVLNPHDV